MIGGRVLDASAIADFITGRSIYTRALVQAAVEEGIVLAVPTAALAAATALAGAKGNAGVRVLLELPVVVIDVLDVSAAGKVGAVLLHSCTDPGQLVAAGHVVHSARRRNWPILTAAPEALLAVDPTVEIERLPYP